jgi:hypothetical protein
MGLKAKHVSCPSVVTVCGGQIIASVDGRVGGKGHELFIPKLLVLAGDGSHWSGLSTQLEAARMGLVLIGSDYGLCAVRANEVGVTTPYVGSSKLADVVRHYFPNLSPNPKKRKGKPKSVFVRFDKT